MSSYHSTKRSTIVRTALALSLPILLLVLVWPAAAQQASSGSRPDQLQAGELLVRLQPDLAADAAAGLPARYQSILVRPLLLAGVQLWSVPEGHELEIARRLEADPGVVYAEPNYVYHALTTPDDPGFPNQWGHVYMQSEAAWSLSTGSTTTKIAIIDSGIDESHPDLAGKIVAGYDFVDGDDSPHDGNGHGTHCAGIAAAASNNGVGVAGMDWQARIMPIRVLGDDGSGYVSDITDGIVWAYTHGARVLNLSLGGTSYSAAQQDAINNAHAAGSLVVAAMGNYGNDVPLYPAAYDNVLAVAATGPSDFRSSFSSYGPHCDVAAPGGDMGYLHDPGGIYSTMPTYACYMTTNEGYYEDYDYVHGTSQAAPYVSGLAALIRSLNGALAPDQVQAIIETTAVDRGAPGWDPYYGHGRINAYAALLAVNPPLYDHRAYLPIVHRRESQAPPGSLRNGDFEAGPTIWSWYSTHGWDIIINHGFPGYVTPHGGSWAAWLGGDYDDVSYVEQRVTVPAATPYLAYYHWIDSADICGRDWAHVLIDGATVHTYMLCDMTNTGGWVRRSINLGSYGGQSVLLQIRVQTDGWANSNLFLDDVSFAAGAGADGERAAPGARRTEGAVLRSASR
jgi:thermitase